MREPLRFVPIEPPRDSTVTLLAAVAARHGVTVADITGERRTRHIVAARWEAIKALHELKPNLSTPQLGVLFRRDHTSILYALGRLSRKPPERRMAAA